MGRRHLAFRARARGAGLIVGLAAIASVALAADGWSTYHNAEFGFSVEMPGTPTVASNPAQTPRGMAPGVAGQLPTAGAGALMFGANDYSKLNPDSDLQGRLDAAVAGAIGNSKQTLDQEIKITVDGIPGRDIVAHNAAMVSRGRILMRRDRMYIVVGVGPTVGGVPADYPRFALSLKPD